MTALLEQWFWAHLEGMEDRAGSAQGVPRLIERLARKTKDPVLAQFYRETHDPASVRQRLARIRFTAERRDLEEAILAFINLKERAQWVWSLAAEQPLLWDHNFKDRGAEQAQRVRDRAQVWRSVWNELAAVIYNEKPDLRDDPGKAAHIVRKRLKAAGDKRGYIEKATEDGARAYELPTRDAIYRHLKKVRMAARPSE
ncbi:hypothetical protein [Hansschlegelia sp. KR7-227]|uniref:hypothetical protein n=1 Tax=Hansschlegelia sp. KR7-227 TaxID=3400914 RepID=UPI003C06BD84